VPEVSPPRPTESAPPAAPGINRREPPRELGDFTTTWRVLPLSLIAIGLGVLSAFAALALLRLIGLCTNLFFYQRWSTAIVSPAGHHLGGWMVVVPVIGGLIVGLMARYGSERIRGHGIPETLEAILVSGSRVEPRVALLKPLSAAIAIGSGGPFGAEGPIIVTGGALGSTLAQFMRLTSAERKALLVAGAAAGMSATFASPVAAVLLAVEVLLFEWKPRSLIPVALASATAAAVRRYIIGMGPLFAVAPHPAFIGFKGLLGSVVAGLLGGLLAYGLTRSVYAAEDAFRLLPIHWIWWPALGGVLVGLGGLISPRALGVGYDVIGGLIHGDITLRVIVGILLVKWIIWSIGLGSGNSGGVLAPLLLMGGALGGVEAMFLPQEGAGFWPLLGMAAILGGAMRAPLTGVIFALELTHDVNMLVPLTLAAVFAYGFSVLVLKRSILTERIARRGYHLSQEYAVDPLEVLLVREVMRTNIVALSPNMPLEELAHSLRTGHRRSQRLYPVVDADGRLTGVITRSDLQKFVQEHSGEEQRRELAELVRPNPVKAFPDEPLRAVAYRMAETGLTRLLVVERDDPQKLAGSVSLNDLLKARVRNLEEERHRERVLTVRRLFTRGSRTTSSPLQAQKPRT